jgi:hypothetical protein
MSEVQTMSQGAAHEPPRSCANVVGQRGFATRGSDHSKSRRADVVAKEDGMATPLSDRPLRLNPGELVNIHDGKGFEVVCLEGAVWITQSNDPRDIVIGATESFVLDKPGVALVCASAGPATVAVETPQRRTAPVLPPYRWSMRSAARALPPASAGL